MNDNVNICKVTRHKKISVRLYCIEIQVENQHNIYYKGKWLHEQQEIIESGFFFGKSLRGYPSSESLIADRLCMYALEEFLVIEEDLVGMAEKDFQAAPEARGHKGVFIVV